MTQFEEVTTAIDELNDVLEAEKPDLPRSDVELEVVDSEYLQPWDQRADETGIDFKMFLHYRDFGLSRTIKGSWDYFNEHPKQYAAEKSGKKNGKDKKPIHLQTLYVISRKNDWAERARKWDVNEERLYQMARSQSVREMAVRHESDIVDAIDALMIPIRALNVKLHDDPDFIDTLSKRDSKQLIEMANRASRTIPGLMNAERLARGMPTEIAGGTVEHQHIISIDRDQIGNVLEILEKSGQFDAARGGFNPGEIIDAEVVEVHSLPTESDAD